MHLIVLLTLIARRCQWRLLLGVSALETVLDGHPVRRWLRGGESAAAVHARAGAAGITLSV